MNVYGENPDGSWTEVAPEPLWVRPWWRLWRWTPYCCGRIFTGRSPYLDHWYSEHTGGDA